MSNIPLQSIPTEMREEIESIVENAVDRRLNELLGDPDEGLEVREELVKRLQEQQRRVAAGERGRPMAGLFKFRVGDYRILYELIRNERRIIIHAIGHRRDVYRQD